MDYAVRMNIPVVLAPFGTRQRLPVLSHVMQAAAAHNVVTVASVAGEVYGRLEWPALYALEGPEFGTFAVAGLTTDGGLLAQVPKAAQGVLAVPGENIVGLGIHSSYGIGSGNAAAAAIVAAFVSMALAHRETTYAELLNKLQKTPPPWTGTPSTGTPGIGADVIKINAMTFLQ
ncbi:hypothetical protein GNI_132860 [Gregarina niphandrodes]|uniref:subtilisin n=1 Tax=Gregarina niphandrodes TaxID=110365 RepID=A0A023B185_GRENI|nr:hypothetical protein GNI_132860 [Gregarina niphandrodes]EZG46812.1 hypothetical protein GNI_132860 [Gregarina niphandrodes]|eukprot:XP_011132236.1 hypothetical protein GNI_132860 [Gregarina niphandrodes]